MNSQRGKTKKRVVTAVAAAAALASVAAGTTVLNNRVSAAERAQVNQAPGNQNDSGQQVVGRDGTQGSGRDGVQTRDGTAVGGTGNHVGGQERRVGPGGQGDRPATGNSAPVNAGDGDQRNGDVAEAPRSSGRDQNNGAGAGSRTDSSGSNSPNAQTGGRVNTGPGSQDDVTNNYPSESPSAGEATLDAVRPADGGTTMGTEAELSITVKKVPTNNNTLFLICAKKSDKPSDPPLYYGRAQLTQPGAQKLVLAFGGEWPDDPSLVGSVRTCGIWTATPEATATLARLMYLDSKKVYIDENDEPYDAERTSLPPGTVQVSEARAITIQRVGAQAS